MNVLVVGSSVIDLFFEIQDKSHINISGSDVILKLGDKIPTDIKKITVGGNGANVSVGLKRLSLDTTFFTFFGTDLFSREIEETIRKEEVKLIAERIGEKSDLSLILDLDGDRIIFSHHEKRNHAFEYSSGKIPGFLYLTSIGNDWQKAYEQVLEFAKKNNIKVGFNPGSHQLEEKTEIVIDAVKACEVIFVNKEEAKKILNWINGDTSDDIKKMLSGLKKLGSKIVSITDGKNGAYAIDANNKFYWIRQFGKDGREKTGAGDAYTSGFLAKYLHGGMIPDCMRQGPVNANSVTEKTGAQEGLLTVEQIEKMLEENQDFRAVEI